MVEFRKVISKDVVMPPVGEVESTSAVLETHPGDVQLKVPEPERSIQEFYLEGLALRAATLEWVFKRPLRVFVKGH